MDRVSVKKWKRNGVKGWTELCDLPWGKQQAHTAESGGPQTPYRKPKQLSIIQQVQSEPATEEKTREERRFEGRGGIEEIYPAWELDTKDFLFFLSMFFRNMLCGARSSTKQPSLFDKRISNNEQIWDFKPSVSYYVQVDNDGFSLKE